jgi:cyanate permease
MSVMPFHRSTAGTVGAASGNPIAVSGIAVGDVLLSIVKWKVGERAVPVATATFVVAAGEIESASVSTNGYYLEVSWTHG